MFFVFFVFLCNYDKGGFHTLIVGIVPQIFPFSCLNTNITLKKFYIRLYPTNPPSPLHLPLPSLQCVAPSVRASGRTCRNFALARPSTPTAPEHARRAASPLRAMGPSSASLLCREAALTLRRPDDRAGSALKCNRHKKERLVGG